MKPTMIRSVIVDDEPLARRRLRALLSEHRDIELVAECADGDEALDVITREHPELVFLDVQMGSMDGLAVARAIAGPAAPAVVVVTAFERYAVEAFGVRALDYILKPFDEDRFLATLQRTREHFETIRRREMHDRLLELVHELERDANGTPRARAILRVADLEIDLGAREVRRGGVSTFLRRKEFDLLVALVRRRGEFVTRRELLAEVWGYKEDVVSRTVDTHIAELRRKLGYAPAETGYIETLAGTGYRIGSTEA